MSTPSAGQDPKPRSAAAIVARPAPSFRSSQPQAEAGARRSWEDGRVHRPRRPGHRIQDLPPWSPGHPLLYRPRQRPHDRDEDPPKPAPGKTGPDASCTKGSAPWSAQHPRHTEGRSRTVDRSGPAAGELVQGAIGQTASRKHCVYFGNPKSKAAELPRRSALKGGDTVA